MPSFTPKARPVAEQQPIDTATQYNSTVEPVIRKTLLEGTPHILPYFQQILREDDVPKRIDVLLDPTQQQYRKINRAEILLQGDFPNSYDPANGQTSITGEIVLYPSIIPNAGDHFVFTTADGQTLLFVLKQPQPITYLQNTAWQAEVEVIGLFTELYQDNLRLKTVQEVYYNADDKSLSVTPNSGVTVSTELPKLSQYYNRMFFDTRIQTYLVPGYDEKVYDPLLVKFVNDVMGRKYGHTSFKAVEYVCNKETDTRFGSILDYILNGTDYSRSSIPRGYGVINAFTFSEKAIHHNIAFSGVSQVIWNESLFDSTHTLAEEVVGPYIFSDDFYTGDTTNMTDHEKAVSRYLSGETFLFSEISDLINSIMELSLKDQFYLIPIFFLIARKSV